MRSGHVRRERAVVDDAAAVWPLRLHEAERVLGAQEDAGEVHVHDGAPLLDRQGVDGETGALRPALLNSTSTRPKASQARAKSASTAASCVTSVATASTRVAVAGAGFLRHAAQPIQAATGEHDP